MTDDRNARSDQDRGLCKACKWWQAEHDDPAAEDTAIGLCVQDELVHFGLQVSGHSGCNRFESRDAEHAGRVAAISGATR
jgi:hypothetical protein